jgi:rhodanese-related sulfurtransferase
MKPIILSVFLALSMLCAACNSSTTLSTTSAPSTTIPQNAIKVSITPHGMLDVSELETALGNEDVFLVNVHIPFEGNIPGTDLFIPYNEVLDNAHLFPVDKAQKIVVYCKVGSMGDDAAQDLISLGYTNVWNLAGGYDAWKEAGLSFNKQ